MHHHETQPNKTKRLSVSKPVKYMTTVFVLQLPDNRIRIYYNSLQQIYNCLRTNIQQPDNSSVNCLMNNRRLFYNCQYDCLKAA